MTLKQYIYRAGEIGLPGFSDGQLRLNLEVTTDPTQADVFVCPEPLFKFTDRTDMDRFTCMEHYIANTGQNADNAPRHVFLDLSEHFTSYLENRCIFISAALTKARLEAYPNSIPWPWPVKDYKDCLIPAGGFRYDITFHGWLSCLARKVAVRSCQESNTLQTYIRTYNNFFGYQTPDEQASRDKQYRHGLKYSRLALTGESIPGVLPYRFFEAMSAGRCQLYVGRNFNLPFANEINYHDFVSFVDIDAADEAYKHAEDWISRYNDGQLIEKGMRARAAWEKWLQPDAWVALMTYAVQAKLEEMNHARRGA